MAVQFYRRTGRHSAVSAGPVAVVLGALALGALALAVAPFLLAAGVLLVVEHVVRRVIAWRRNRRL